MTDAEYHSHPAISREHLLLLADSPEWFHAVRSGGMDADEVAKVMNEIDPESKKQDAFGVGDATHRLIFEPHTVEDRFIVPPSQVLAKNGAWNGNAFKHWREWAEAAGKVPVKEGKLALARMVAKSAHRTLSPLLVQTAIHERPLFWTETVVLDDAPYPVACRGKPDYLVVDESRQMGVIIDLKTCAGVTEFRYSIAKYRYWMQAAHYRAGFQATYGFWPRFYFAAVEKKPPFRCRLVQLDDKSEDEAHRRREELLQDLVRRTRDDDWTDPVTTDIETVSISI